MMTVTTHRNAIAAECSPLIIVESIEEVILNLEFSQVVAEVLL